MDSPIARASATGSRPDWELLLLGARSKSNAAVSERIREIARAGVDWDRLVLLASVHHVVPLLYRSLFEVCPEAVPKAILAQLQRTFSLNAARNRVLCFELIQVLKCLGEHDIAAVPYKGPTLAALAYGGLALRQAGDLDILVRERDALRARHLLISRGFRGYLELTEDQERNGSHHFILVRDDRPLSVEIHWQLIEGCLSFNLSTERLLQSASFTMLAGVRVPCFPTPELLIYLCAHGGKHCWERISWICDIAELIQVEPRIDWDLVMGKAREIGAERLLSVGLLLAVEILGAPLSEAIVCKIRTDGAATDLVRQVYERFLSEPDSPPEFAEIWKFNLSARERRRDRLRCRLKLAIGGLKPNERDRDFVRLPSHLSFLYRGVKPVRLAMKFVHSYWPVS